MEPEPDSEAESEYECGEREGEGKGRGDVAEGELLLLLLLLLSSEAKTRASMSSWSSRVDMWGSEGGAEAREEEESVRLRRRYLMEGSANSSEEEESMCESRNAVDVDDSDHTAESYSNPWCPWRGLAIPPGASDRVGRVTEQKRTGV